MSNEEKSSRRHPDRVTMLPQHLEKIDGWIGQVKESCKGVLVSRNQILQWVIENRCATLDADDLRALGSQFFQEEIFLKQVSVELKVRRAAGECVTLGELMSQILPPNSASKKSRKKSIQKIDAAAEEKHL